MKRIKQLSGIIKKTAVLAFLCAFSVDGYPQRPSIEAENRRRNEDRQKRQQEKDLAERRAKLDSLQPETTVNKPHDGRATRLREERELREKFTAPETADLELYKDFLKQPRTGIFRLFPDNDCLVKGVVRVDGNCREIFPGTWFYSFREKDYSDNILFDLHLKDGKLITDGFLSLGILVKLGNVSLEDVTLESKGAKFLVEFKSFEKAADIKGQYEGFGAVGIEADGYKYTREIEAQVNEVYLMRVIAYRLQKKLLDKIPRNTVNETHLKFLMVERDEREDMTIAFRIIRKEAAGNVTIIWKELDKKKSPEIIFSGL